MEFPALKDTNFPNLANANPYAYQNNFDYERWDGVTKIKLVTVPWDFAYRNVVAFETDNARDNYFKNLRGTSVELTSDYSRMPDGSIRVSVPIDVVNRYNYVCVEIPQYTPNEPLDYENNNGVRKLYYFITDTIYRSPSATEILLALDVWTTYINSVEVTSIFLERGHAPMYDVTATQYLANPRENNIGLLTPDINYGSADVISGTSWKPLHTSDEKYLLLASTIPYSKLSTIGAGTAAGASTPPTYANRETRSGYQEIVNGYVWGEGGYSYTNAKQPANVTGSTDSYIPNGLYMYAIKYADFTDGMETLATVYPHFIESVVETFIVPKSLITLGTSRTLGSLTFYEARANDNIDATQFKLTKELFNYPERYADIAKLYTSPYASLEFSDDNNNTFEVKIENTGNSIEVMEQVSLAAPFLRWDVLFTNLHGEGNTQYMVRKLDGASERKNIASSDFQRFMFKWDIPTYSIYLEAARAHALRVTHSAAQERVSALVNYQNTVRSANTGRENTLDENATSKTNTDAAADTSVVNANNAAQNAIDNNDIANATLNANATRANADAAAMNILNNTNLGLALTSDQTLQDALLNNNIETRASTTVAAGLGGLAGGAIQGAAAGAAVGSIVPGIGTIAGAAVGGAVSAIPQVLTQAVTSELHNYVLATSEANELAASKANQNSHLNLQQSLNSNGTNISVNEQLEITANNILASEQQTDNNAILTRTTANNNATTSKGNASRTKNTGDANATYSRNTTIENAKATLELAQDNYISAYKTAALGMTEARGTYSGDPTLDMFARRGVHMRVKTQSKDAIARAGDYFIRFGYAYNGFYAFDSWTKNKDYCYWKAQDVELLPTKGASANIINMLTVILENGTTVYSDPAKIGRF